MSQNVVTGALLQCSMGVAPSSLNVLPLNRVMVEGKPAATIMDNKPFLNILPFGVCTSLANPQTAALTTAALGVLTPGPCLPVTPAPWVPGSPTALIGAMPALSNTSKCMCVYGGVIQILMPGAFTSMVP